MEENGLTLYKLMILFLIKKVDFPLSNSQISEFILDKGYTTYFKLQQAFHELEDERHAADRTGKKRKPLFSDRRGERSD